MFIVYRLGERQGGKVIQTQQSNSEAQARDGVRLELKFKSNGSDNNLERK